MPFLSLFISLLISFIWGLNFVVIKFCLLETKPLTLCFLRFFLTSIPLVLFTKRPKTHFSLLLLYGVVMFVIQFGLLFLGLYLGMPAGLSSLILQVQVFFSLFIGMYVFDEKIRPWNWIGCMISFLGIGTVIWNLDSSVSYGGLLCILGTAACSSLGNLITKKVGQVNSFSLVAWGSFIAWPILLALSLAIEGPTVFLDTLFDTQVDFWIGAAYITYLATLFAYGAWSWLVRNNPLKAVTPFTLLTPIFALFGGTIFLDEPFPVWKLFATVLVLAGLAINLFGHYLLRPAPVIE
jgi:O-acetylserine/cysteine efflux transporter